jgi:hypothetical protein
MLLIDLVGAFVAIVTVVSVQAQAVTCPTQCSKGCPPQRSSCCSPNCATTCCMEMAVCVGFNGTTSDTLNATHCVGGFWGRECLSFCAPTCRAKACAASGSCAGARSSRHLPRLCIAKTDTGTTIAQARAIPCDAPPRRAR